MSRKIKLIWDFKGESALKTAEHHNIHLQEFIISKKYELNITGFDKISDLHAIAYMVVAEVNMIEVRDLLKPHRGEVYDL